MSIDMNTHGREIRKAIDEVVADSGNDWCIFGYEGKSYTLKVLTEGDGGLEEMVDEFHGSKIMYGYCKVKEPNTGLPKYVFINWQGEGAPERMKFACGSHSSEVQRVCRITHVTINARDDSDVIPSEIIGRVVSASGSQHSVLKSSNIDAPVEPVKPPKPSKGSVYKKVNATSEILNRERDAYWQKIEAEERKAKQEDEQRRREEKERREREVRERDRREAAERERRTSERSQQIAQQRVHERQSQMQITKQQSQQEVMDDVAEYENERRMRSASLKNERQAELASLIAQRNASGLEPSQRVGTNYKKIDPRQELVLSTRDQYWTDLEAEEAKIKEEEKRRRQQELASIERSRKEREEEETRRRESQERARSTAIAQQRQAERERAELDKKRTKEAQERAIHQEAIADEKERQSRSERLRKERQEEAARLIGQRGSGGGGVSNARNFFQQQNSQSESRPSPQRPMPGRLPRMGVPASNPLPVPEPEPEPEPVVQTVTPPAPQPVYQPAYQPAYQPESQQQRRESSGFSEEEEAPVHSYNPVPVQEPVLEQPAQPSDDDRGFCCEALYDYEATEEDEISFNPGDIIIRIEQIDEGWWMGEDTQGHRGLFPANYVKPL